MRFKAVRKRFFAQSTRHQNECYGAVVGGEQAAPSLAWLEVHGKRETLLVQASGAQEPTCLAQDTYVLSPCFAGSHLFWVERCGKEWLIRSARLDDECTVREPLDLPGRPLSLSSWDAEDEAWLVWEQRQGRQTQVWIAHLFEDQLGPPVPVSDAALNAYDPVCALGAGDRLYVLYTAFVDGNYRVLLQALGRDGEAQGAAQRVSDRAEPCLYPSVWPATAGGVWFSYTSLCGPQRDGNTSSAFVRHFRYQAQKAVFGQRGVAFAGRFEGGRLWAVNAPRNRQGFTAAMTVGGSAGSGHTQVFEDTEGRLRLLLRQHGEVSDSPFECEEPAPLRRSAQPGAQSPPQTHPSLYLATLMDEDWSPPELIVPRAHLDAPLSFRLHGSRLQVAFTEDSRRTGWSGAGEWFDGEGQLGVGIAELELQEPGRPRYAWRPFRLSPTAGPSLQNPALPEAKGPYLQAMGQTHAHTNLSICVREQDRDPHLNFRFMQDVQDCRFGMTTDHAYNMWHTEMLLVNKLADYYYFPGEFVAAPAYEWTGSDRRACSHEGGPFGHVNPIYLEEEGELEIYTPCDPSCDGGSLERLWKAYRGQAVVTPPHHMADHLHAYNWRFFSEQLVPVVETFQDSRGSAEHPQAAGVTNFLHQEEGHWVVDQLRAGRKFGFIASADHTGLALAGLLVEELTRSGLYEALQARRCFGTTGVGLRVDFTGNGRPMGSEVRADEAVFRLAVESPEALREVHVVRNGEDEEILTANGTSCEHCWAAQRRARSEFWYCRILLENGEMAWTSPIWVEAE